MTSARYRASFELLAAWPVKRAAVVFVDQQGNAHSSGPVDELFRLASVTKILTSYAVLIAIEEGIVSLDDPLGPIGPPQSTLRHLLSHASGWPLNGDRAITPPERRRVYSNTGINAAAAHVEQRAEMPFGSYLDEAVFQPLNMHHTKLYTAPAWGAGSTANDLAKFARELLAPTLIASETLHQATSPQWPELNGVLPGLGPQRPNTWGLGFEIRDHKSPHWTGTTNSPETFGHFGQSGTFLWVDPTHNTACVTLTGTDFGRWAREFWPPFSDSLLSAALGQLS